MLIAAKLEAGRRRSGSAFVLRWVERFFRRDLAEGDCLGFAFFLLNIASDL